MKCIYLSGLLTLFAMTLFSQSPQEIELGNGNRFLLGPVTENDLSQGTYGQWYTPNFNGYRPDLNELDHFKASLAGYHILIFLGTWCGDSKREVPRFLKILETAEFPKEQLKIIALDQRSEHYKKSPTGEEWGLKIVRIPTFIFLKNGKEVNRIVESPVNSLEEDMAAIVSQKPYTPNYSHLLKVTN